MAGFANVLGGETAAAAGAPSLSVRPSGYTWKRDPHFGQRILSPVAGKRRSLTGYSAAQEGQATCIGVRGLEERTKPNTMRRLTYRDPHSYRPGVTEKRTVTLEIAGAKYRMTSDADEAHLARLAGIINERIDALGPKAQRTATPAQLLAVVALGLVDDLMSAERRRREVEDSTRAAVHAAIAKIDERLRA
jgi:cell division protein ZapA (FtsZ GTPase activity inhibitor)